MAFIQICVAVSLLTAVVDGYAGSFSGVGVGGFAGATSYAGGFPRFPQWSRGRLPFQQPFNQGFFNFPTVGLLPSFGTFPNWNAIPGGSVSGMTMTSNSVGSYPYKKTIPMGSLSGITMSSNSMGSFSNLDSLSGGTVNGMTITSTNNGDDSFSVLTTMNDGEKHVYMSNPSKAGSFIEVTKKNQDQEKLEQE